MQDQLTVRILDNKHLHDAEILWKSLEKKVKNPHLVTRWDWVSTWLAHFGDIVDYWFCVGFVGKKVVAITLVTKETPRYLPFPVSAYHIGTQGEPLKDWIHMVNNSILSLDEYTVPFTKQLAKTLIHNFSWEECILEDATPAFAETFYKAAKRYVKRSKKIDQICYRINLEAMRQKNMSAFDYFSRDTRYQIRRSLKEFGDVDVTYAENVTQAKEIFSELQQLHQASLTKKGKRGSYASERFVAFHNDVIPTLFDTGAIILFKVSSKRLGTLGCFYLLNDNGTAFGYSSGLADFSQLTSETINTKRLKPGFVMHALCIEECLKRGINEYNFSTGSQGYKLELTSDTTILSTVKLTRSLRASFREALYESYLKAEEQQQFQAILKPLYSLYLRLHK